MVLRRRRTPVTAAPEKTRYAKTVDFHPKTRENHHLWEEKGASHHLQPSKPPYQKPKLKPQFIGDDGDGNNERRKYHWIRREAGEVGKLER
ncbi:hypothetical protein A2U01_0040255 [Trifolium medium]|uniref:Uncharacterized protein n=1 Tax=Trifolium medium TaxID=97028 RepID=A0A392Q5V3_9FABA|nr:hypothetical protein [Trifolium medium]